MHEGQALISSLAMAALAIQVPVNAQVLPKQEPQLRTIVYVDADATGNNDGTNWHDAYVELQDALSAARNNPRVREIWVAEGTYHPAPPNGSRSATFLLVDGVGLYGGFAGWETDHGQRDRIANPTNLSGDLNGNDGPDFSDTGENSYHVVKCTDNAQVAILDGFIIASGNASSYFSFNDTHHGGGLYAENASLVLSNCIFSGHSAKYGGGGLYAETSALAVIDCGFHDNRTRNYYGGAIELYGTDAYLMGCAFEGNTAVSLYEAGGAVALLSGAVDVNDCFFVDNDTTRGGAGYSWDSDMVVEDCVFHDNRAASRGGAVYVQRSGGSRNTEFVDCAFSRNQSQGDGGAICFFYDDYGDYAEHVTGCTFAENAAAEGGGAIWADSWSLVLINNDFSRNQGNKGGAIWAQRKLVMVNCLLNANVATSDWGAGGAVYTIRDNDYNWTNIANCTFTHNRADDGYGGGLFAGGANEAVRNCIFWGNSDIDGVDESSQIHRTTGSFVLDYSCVQGLTGEMGGDGNIGDSPMFVDLLGPDGIAGTADDDLRLAAGSPCIDAGDNTAVPADTADLDGDLDLDERTPLDLAGHARFVDHPDVPDTGVADPPDYPEVVDMGAYETPCCCEGDLDDDGLVGLNDLATLIAHYEQPGPWTPADGDLDGDGDVDLADLSALLAEYDTACA